MVMLTLELVTYAVLYWILFGQGFDFDKHIGIFLFMSVLIYIVYALIIFSVSNIRKVPKLAPVLVSIFIVSLLLSKNSFFSNDIYRYLWDGGLLSQGINPYAFTPSARALENLQHSQLYLLIDWKDAYTPYPPLAQAIFMLAYNLFSHFGLVLGKMVFSLPIVTLALLLWLQKNKKLSIILVLNPLVALEVYYGSHIDGYVILFIFLAVLFYFRKHYLLSSLFITLGFLTKIYPILFLPFFLIDLIRKKKHKEAALYFIVFLSLSFLLYYPFVKDSLPQIARYWSLFNEQEFNASFYRYSYQILGHFWANSREIAKYVSTAFLGLVSAYLLTKKLSIRSLLAVGFSYLLSSPLVFPWHTLFLISFFLVEIRKTKNYALFYPLIAAQLFLTFSYFEPEKKYLREILLNIEYFLIFISIIYYRKMAKFRQ